MTKWAEKYQKGKNKQRNRRIPISGRRKHSLSNWVLSQWRTVATGAENGRALMCITGSAPPSSSFFYPWSSTHLVPVPPFISLLRVLFSSRPEGRLTYRFRERERERERQRVAGVVQSGLRRRVCVVQKCWRRLRTASCRPSAVSVDHVADNRCAFEPSTWLTPEIVPSRSNLLSTNFREKRDKKKKKKEEEFVYRYRRFGAASL